VAYKALMSASFITGNARKYVVYASSISTLRNNRAPLGW